MFWCFLQGNKLSAIPNNTDNSGHKKYKCKMSETLSYIKLKFTWALFIKETFVVKRGITVKIG